MAVDDTIDDGMIAWIEENVGGRVARVERFSHAGRSRSLWSLDAEVGNARIPLILKREVGGGPFTGTAITPGREAAVMKALAGTGVPVPKVHAISASGNDMVMERLPGLADFTFPNADEEQKTVADYAAALGALHRLDPRDLALPFDVPPNSDAAIRAHIEEFDEAYRKLCDRHEVIDRAHHWLCDCALGAIDRTVLTHGDAGPGNFLHRDGVVTGLIDWEMTHLGGIEDDLAWIWFRTAVLKQGGDYRTFHRLYREATGTVIDPTKLTYHAVMIVYRCTIVCHIRQAHDPAHDDNRPSELRQMLGTALADVERTASPRLIPDFAAARTEEV